MGTVQPRSVVDTLSATESGGNPNAWRRNKDGREFVGQWQFGEARLRDLGLGKDFTMDEFKSSPDLQRNIMNKHVAEINSFIEKNGLDLYEGQTINGTPITRSGMIAMAHLGGNGGMRRFLESGGTYNPADELGTSLADYAMKHGGPTVASTPEATSDRLRNFAVDADGRALGVRSASEEALTTSFDKMFPSLRAQANPNGPFQGPQNVMPVDPYMNMMPSGPLGFGSAVDGTSLPPGVGPGQMPPATQLGFGSAVPEGASPFAANGMPDPIRMGAMGAPGGPPLSFGPQGGPPGFSIDPAVTGGSSTFASPNEVDPRVSSSGGGGVAAPGAPGDPEAEPEDPERNGFLTRIGRMIFGEDEEDPDGRLKTLIGGIGVGLGQMSAGMPVDLQPYFANVAANKQNAIDAAMREQQQAIDNELAYYNADTNRMNADTARMRYEQEAAEAARKGLPSSLGLSPETITKYADIPTTAPFVEMMLRGDEESRKIGMQGFKEAVLKDTADKSTKPEVISDLYTALNNGDTDAVADILRDNNIPVEDIKRLADITDPGMMMKNAERLADENADPEIVEKFMQLSRLAGGVSDNQYDKDNYAEGRQYYNNLLRSVSENRNLNFNVNTLRTKALEQAMGGKAVAGFTDELLAPYLAMAESVLPPNWMNTLYDQVGVDLKAYQEMDALSRFIVLQAARPLMEGQGSVTDGERKDLAMSLTTTGLTFEAQMAALDKLSVLSDMDISMAHYYRENQQDKFHSNFPDLQADLELDSGAAINAIYASRANWTALRNMKASPAYEAAFTDADGNMLPAEVIMSRVAPRLTRKQYYISKHALAEYEDIWIDADTNQLMRGTQPFKPPSN
jgi:hypothetical protein